MSDELIQLPEGWRIEKIETVCDFNPKHDKSILDNTEISFVPMSALDEKTGQIRDKYSKVLGEVRKGYTHFADGDIIFAKITPCMENGKSTVARNLINGFACGSTEFYVLRSYAALVPEYLYYFLRQRSYLEIAAGAMTGVVGQRRLPKKFLLETKIPLPPLNEQKRIVTKIEELTDRTQKAKEALDSIPQLCDRFRQSVLAAAFRGDLTKKWREQNPDVEPSSVLLDMFKQERRNCWEGIELEKMKAKGMTPKDNKWKSKYKDPQEFEKLDGVDLPELPNGWVWMSVDECTSLVTDGEHATPERSNSGVYLLSARNVLDGKVSLEKVDFIAEPVHQKLEERLKIEAGDVFLSCSGTVGRSCVVPQQLRCSLVRSVAVLKPLFSIGEYLSLALRSYWVQTQIERKKTQTAQSNIFQGRIKTLAIPLPPLKEQKEIVSKIQTLFKIIDNIEKQHQQATEKLETLNQSILAKAFRGELVPQDPNDKPASLLLERIKSEQEKLNPNKPKSKRTTKPNKKPNTIES